MTLEEEIKTKLAKNGTMSLEELALATKNGEEVKVVYVKPSFKRLVMRMCADNQISLTADFRLKNI